jgi:dihydroorotate dehydrogenase (fumarate)
MTVADLSTTYLNMQLANPLLPSASPLSRSLDNIRRLEDAGASGVVLHSLFQEQIGSESHILDRYLNVAPGHYWRVLDYYPRAQDFALSPHQYLEHVRQAKAAVRIPVIASLNGVTPGGWLTYASMIEEAGADALELNVFYVPTDPRLAPGEIERRILELVVEVRQRVNVSLAVKLSPAYASLPAMAHQLVDARVDGIVLFNEFNETDIDLETFNLVARPPTSMDTNADALSLRLRWIAILRPQTTISLAASGGVHSATDALKLIVAGADATMLASELLVHGIDRLRQIRDELNDWLDRRNFGTLNEVRGQLKGLPDSDQTAFERARYVRSAGTS